MAETEDAPWPNADTAATRVATTMSELLERLANMGDQFDRIVAAYHGKLQSVIRRVMRSGLMGKTISFHETTALKHRQIGRQTVQKTEWAHLERRR